MVIKTIGFCDLSFLAQSQQNKDFPCLQEQLECCCHTCLVLFAWYFVAAETFTGFGSLMLVFVWVSRSLFQLGTT